MIIKELIFKYLDKADVKMLQLYHNTSEWALSINGMSFRVTDLIDYFCKVFDASFSYVHEFIKKWWNDLINKLLKKLTDAVNLYRVELGNFDWFITNNDVTMSLDSFIALMEISFKGDYDKNVIKQYVNQFYSHGQTNFFEDKKNQKKFGFYI